MGVIRSNEWLQKMKMEEIKRNIDRESNSVIDINHSVRDTDGDRGIKMDVAAEGHRIIDGGVQQDDLDENAKKKIPIKDPMN